MCTLEVKITSDADGSKNWTLEEEEEKVLGECRILAVFVKSHKNNSHQH
jgi:hypothetical protein